MSREIKFRLWDKAHKVFIPDHVFAVCPDGDRAFAVIIEDWENYREGECAYANLQALSQYTGLKDKKKQEVYESDVMRVLLPMGGFWGDVKKEKIGVVRYEADYGGFIVEWEYSANQHHVRLDCDIACTGEVIGNIHDNPDLINPKQPNQAA